MALPCLALRVISPAEARRVLERAGFWDMASFEDSAGMDGSQAVLEAVRAGRYHVVDRWSPHDTPYAKLITFLLELGEG